MKMWKAESFSRRKAWLGEEREPLRAPEGDADCQAERLKPGGRRL
jgi:hypothetical protein